MPGTAAGVRQLDLTKRLVQRLFEFKQQHGHSGHTTRPRSSPRLAHVALRHAGAPTKLLGQPEWRGAASGSVRARARPAAPSLAAKSQLFERSRQRQTAECGRRAGAA